MSDAALAPAASATRSRISPARAPAWTLTAALGLVYLIASPPSPDLAAASYRSYLFSTEGFSLWDSGWYGGHHLPAYSLLAPALGAAIGPQLLATVSMIVAAALFATLIEGRFPARATRIGGLWFAFGAAVSLLSCRVPFDLGLALGLGALLAAQRRARVAAVTLSVLASIASPVAGAFLALALIAWALAGPHRRWPTMLALVALAPIGLLALVFPEGGTQPFAASSFYPALAGVIVVGALLPPEQRELRIGFALYAIALTASYAIPTAVGGNADRLGALAAGPIAACALACARPVGWTPGSAGPAVDLLRRRALIALSPLLLYWQVNAPVADFASAVNEPAVEASYYAPLVRELHSLGVGYGARPARVEVVPSTDHWEARWVAPHVMIARGWERQLDVQRNSLFYEDDESLSAASYRAWLLEQAISYVALPDSPLDYSARAEGSLLRGEGKPGNGAAPAYLREVWRSAHWRLFEVLGARPLAQPPALLTSAGRNSFTLRAPGPGSFQVRIRFTPYWALSTGRGCVQEGAGSWTQLRARSATTMHVVIRFSPARVFDHGPRCR
ncbi:MAG TPA: hypothetical protein VKG82_03515 [Solirubrobacteraceae bacterium]|nr:hypothetical protein [Solirubrobacteraceae bacterium]